MKLTTNKKIIFIIIVILVILTIFLIWQNNSIIMTNINYVNNAIPDGFNGYRIVHISDLHNKKFGSNQKELINKIKKVSPDIIVITGDLIDRRRYNLDIAMEFVEEALKFAPVYYVSGNHEAWSGKYDTIKQELTKVGVIILDDKRIELERENEIINILGLSDPAFVTTEYSEKTDTSLLRENIELLSTNENFEILLSHRPELFDIYIENNVDVVFSGHAHGGQIRIPFIGALFAPNQGVLPKYTSGEYKQGNTTMIVSRGLGNSLFPFRIFNRPEIIVVNLYNK